MKYNKSLAFGALLFLFITTANAKLDPYVYDFKFQIRNASGGDIGIKLISSDCIDDLPPPLVGPIFQRQSFTYGFTAKRCSANKLTAVILRSGDEITTLKFSKEFFPGESSQQDDYATYKLEVIPTSAIKISSWGCGDGATTCEVTVGEIDD